MRKAYLFLLIGFFLNEILWAQPIKPCQTIGFKKIEAQVFIDAALDEIPEVRKEMKSLLARCVKEYAVCIIERPPGKRVWLDKHLNQPSVDPNFNDGTSDLLFGLLQYVEKNTGAGVCIVVKNVSANALPWYGASWVIDGKTIKEYEISELFTMGMTPKSLYKVMLASHQEAVETRHYRDE